MTFMDGRWKPVWIVKKFCVSHKNEKPDWIDVIMGRSDKDKLINYCTRRKQYIDEKYTSKDCAMCRDYHPRFGKLL